MDRKLIDWPNDVIELADYLRIEKFHVLRMSGGGPYVAASAFKIPERILSAGIIGGMGPYKETKKMLKNPNRTLFSLLKMFPYMSKLFIVPMWNRFRKLEFNEKTSKLIAKQGKQLPEPDKMIYNDPIFQKFFVFYIKDILQQGSKGPFLDGKLLVKPWNFKLEEIPTDLKFYTWYGELDINVAVEVGKFFALKIPNCEAFYYPKEAHLSLIPNKLNEILSKLVE